MNLCKYTLLWSCQQTHQWWRDDYSSLDSSLLSPPFSDTLRNTYKHTHKHTINTHLQISEWDDISKYDKNLISFDTTSSWSAVLQTYPVQFNRFNPLVSVLGVLSSEVPNTVVYTYIQPALVKFMSLKKNIHTEKEYRTKTRLISVWDSGKWGQLWEPSWLDICSDISIQFRICFHDLFNPTGKPADFPV